jgi:hypothetical protein
LWKIQIRPSFRWLAVLYLSSREENEIADMSNKDLADQLAKLSKAYDELRAECLEAARYYSELMGFDEEPEVIAACASIPARAEESPEALSIMFDSAFDTFFALASQIDRDRNEWCSDDPRGIELPVYKPEEETLKFVSERVEAYRPLYRWQVHFARTRAQDRSEAMGWASHPLFRANARNTSMGVVTSAMDDALRDGKRHFGEFATFEWQQLWRFDTFAGDPSPAWYKILGVEWDAWARAGSETHTRSIDGLFERTYVDGEGIVQNGACWVRVEFKASTMKTVMTLLGPTQQQGFSLQETDQYNEKAGKEMQPVRYRK